MKLHKDSGAFIATLQSVRDASGIRADILEKDYYVTLILKELAEKQDSLPAFFKGGTALYKALGTIQRFSEDIDLTVRTDDCSNTQAKRRLERASKEYRSLARTTNVELEHNRKGSISCAYDYHPIVDHPLDDPLQRFGFVRVEATSFTVSEPTHLLEIAPVLFERATANEKKRLRENFDIAPFSVETINMERIFVDKIFATEFYYERALYRDVAKHIYDIAVMLELEQIKLLLSNQDWLKEMVGYKRKQEDIRIGSDLGNKRFSDFLTVGGIRENAEMAKAFDQMQEIYVFDKSYLIEYAAASDALAEVLKIVGN